ncbi:MAG: ATP-binding protein [Calditrichaeota bacterium]|nr:ATP-binding protein [Calditrichota bacterium]HQU71034.1 ATP-binding protein [Calditrichia bacterium]
MKGKTRKISDVEEELIIPSDFKYLSVVEAFIVNLCKRAGLGEDQSDNMAIAITELVNNAIVHANKQDPHKLVTLGAYYHDNRVVVKIRDQGQGFDPNKIANPTDPQNLWKQSGRGVFLVRNLIDEVEIESSDQGTLVTLTEYISQN